MIKLTFEIEMVNPVAFIEAAETPQKQLANFGMPQLTLVAYV